MRIKTSSRFGILLGLACLGPAAWASPRVTVKGGSGTVTVTGSADAKQVKGSGVITVQGDDVRVKGNRPDEALAITVPSAADLEVATWSGSITVKGVKGRVRLKTVSGDIQVRDAAGVECKSVSGGINAEQVSGPLEAKTVNGGIRVKGNLGTARASTVSGKITLEGFAGGRVATTSGNTRLQGVLRKGGEGKVVTHSGSVDVVIRAPDGLKYSLRSMSGALQVKGADKPAGTGKELSGKEASGVVGAGGASLELTSFSGDIHLEVKK